MKESMGKPIHKCFHTVKNILFRLIFVALAIISILSFLMDLVLGHWISALVMGVIAFLFSVCAKEALDFRPEYQVSSSGIWFRDYGVTVPYGYMERGEYCTVQEMHGNSYEVDIFLSSAAFEEGQKKFQKLQKKLRREKKIRMILLEEEREKYESLCRVLKSKIPMRDASNDPIAE